MAAKSSNSSNAGNVVGAAQMTLSSRPFLKLFVLFLFPIVALSSSTSIENSIQSLELVDLCNAI